MPSLRFKKLDIAQCRHGMMVWPRSDSTIGRSLFLYGEFAEGENRVMGQYVSPGQTVIDVGANLGTTVLALSNAVGDTGSVLAFEPQPLMTQCLNTSLTLNERFNVRVFSAALADSTGWGSMPAPDVSQGGNYGAIGLTGDGIQIPLMTLDDLELEACSLIKIDVEGLEWSVIRGAQKSLLKFKPVLYLEAKKIPGTTNYLRWLVEHGWRCYWHFAFFYSQNNYRKNTKNVFGTVGDMNVLAVPTDQPQPDNLPEVTGTDENWEASYMAFFKERGIDPP